MEVVVAEAYLIGALGTKNGYEFISQIYTDLLSAYLSLAS